MLLAKVKTGYRDRKANFPIPPAKSKGENMAARSLANECLFFSTTEGVVNNVFASVICSCTHTAQKSMNYACTNKNGNWTASNTFDGTYISSSLSFDSLSTPYFCFPSDKISSSPVHSCVFWGNGNAFCYAGRSPVSYRQTCHAAKSSSIGYRQTCHAAKLSSISYRQTRHTAKLYTSQVGRELPRCIFVYFSCGDRAATLQNCILRRWGESCHAAKSYTSQVGTELPRRKIVYFSGGDRAATLQNRILLRWGQSCHAAFLYTPQVETELPRRNFVTPLFGELSKHIQNIYISEK